MLAGAPPFTDSKRNFDKIERLILENKPVFNPDIFSENAVSLITSNKKIYII